jgi:hypothetical protein
MSWPSRQQRALHRIEKTLLADDRHLGSLFAVFTRNRAPASTKASGTP